MAESKIPQIKNLIFISRSGLLNCLANLSSIFSAVLSGARVKVLEKAEEKGNRQGMGI